ncbi:hypothetical protein HDU97_001673 [Phlyctochytrium planicorne]|nr:hypothetical protein HDU97_001673 [Phlyctochytrium planicorne]
MASQCRSDKPRDEESITRSDRLDGGGGKDGLKEGEREAVANGEGNANEGKNDDDDNKSRIKETTIQSLSEYILHGKMKILER